MLVRTNYQSPAHEILANRHLLWQALKLKKEEASKISDLFEQRAPNTKKLATMEMGMGSRYTIVQSGKYACLYKLTSFVGEAEPRTSPIQLWDLESNTLIKRMANDKVVRAFNYPMLVTHDKDHFHVIDVSTEKAVTKFARKKDMHTVAINNRFVAITRFDFRNDPRLHLEEYRNEAEETVPFPIVASPETTIYFHGSQLFMPCQIPTDKFPIGGLMALDLDRVHTKADDVLKQLIPSKQMPPQLQKATAQEGVALSSYQEESFLSHLKPVSSMAIDGNFVVTTNGATFMIWNHVTETLYRTIHLKKEDEACRVEAFEAPLLVTTNRKTVKVWDVFKNVVVHQLELTAPTYFGVAFHKGKLFYCTQQAEYQPADFVVAEPVNVAKPSGASSPNKAKNSLWEMLSKLF